MKLLLYILIVMSFVSCVYPMHKYQVIKSNGDTLTIEGDGFRADPDNRNVIYFSPSMGYVKNVESITAIE